jgi:fumarate reductase subunit C
MQPANPGRTRTAPPQLPEKVPMGSRRYRAYTLFDWTGLIYLLLGFLALEIVWMLGSGAEEWRMLQDRLRSPWYVGFHVIALISVIFVGIRFFSLFPKAQPPRIGPAKPPPAPVILAGLYAAWIGITVIFSLILSGALFR